jgi:hypothetical protein
MPTNDRGNEHGELIEYLKAQAAAAIGGHMVACESAGLTPEVQEQFWWNVVAFETAGRTDLIKELQAIGVELPEPDVLDDVALHKSLWRLIEGLARLRVFLEQTDHLSDRELYTQLLRELLREEMPALDVDKSSAWHINVLGYDKPELYLKYYADEKTRESWTFQTIRSPLAKTHPTVGISTCRTVSSRGDRTVHRQRAYGKDYRQPSRGFISRLVSATTGSQERRSGRLTASNPAGRSAGATAYGHFCAPCRMRTTKTTLPRTVYTTMYGNGARTSSRVPSFFPGRPRFGNVRSAVGAL